MQEPVRLSELLAALSLAADLGNGVPIETTLRTCLLATRLAREASAGASDVAATFYTGLLWSAGCTSTAPEETRRFGDDIAIKSAMAGTDFSRPPDILRHAARAGGLHGVAAMLAHGRAHGADIAALHCEAAARLASRVGLEPATLLGIGAFYEWWNGKGGPNQLSGDAIPLAARAARVAHAVVFALRAGADPLRVVRSRAGGELDPELSAVLGRKLGDLLSGLTEESVWSQALEIEPEPRPWAPPSRLDDFAAALGDFVDLKSVYWFGHNSGVAQLAAAAATTYGIDDAELPHLRRAAHMHWLGRVAVSNRIWDKTGPLSIAEWERVRLYPYFTERIVTRAGPLADAGRLASGTQERLDGSGYHRGLPAAAQPATLRLLAAAAAYQSLIEDRPHRQRLEPVAAEAQLRAEAKGGRLDGEAVRAVLEAAGHPRRRGAWPAGLTDREVEVLRLVTRGSTNRQVATRLSISEDTARNHVKHIYEKVGVSTRAGAALFAMEQGLFLAER